MQRRCALGLVMSAPLLTAPARADALPAVSAGRIERMASFASRHVEARHVDVWLPPGYDGRRPHAVLYAHDGQMLFDPRSTWNGQAWKVDQVAAPLIAVGQLLRLLAVLPASAPEVLARVIVQVTMPALIVVILARARFEPALLPALLATTLALLAALALGALWLRLLGADRPAQGAAGLVSAFSNTAFLGLPFVLARYPGSPSAATTAVVIDTVDTTILLLTLGVGFATTMARTRPPTPGPRLPRLARREQQHHAQHLPVRQPPLPARPGPAARRVLRRRGHLRPRHRRRPRHLRTAVSVSRRHCRGCRQRRRGAGSGGERGGDGEGNPSQKLRRREDEKTRGATGAG